MHDRTAAAIIAGGAARRFAGRDKCRLVIEGGTIIVRQVDVLQRVASELVIVGSPPYRFADLGLPVHADVRPGLGVIGGIYTALSCTTSDRVITIACDMPFLVPALLARLAELSAAHDGAWVRTSRGPEPLVACYERHALPKILAAIDAGRLKAGDLGSTLDLAELDRAAVDVFGSADRLLANINTPEDYARVQLSAP